MYFKHDQKLPSVLFLRDKNKVLHKFISKEYIKIENAIDKNMKEIVFYYNCFSGEIETIDKYDRTFGLFCPSCSFYKKVINKRVMKIV